MCARHPRDGASGRRGAARATPAALVGRAVRWMPALLLLALCGCAYFNTFYNAKKQFGKAEEERRGATARPGEIPAATTTTGAQVLGPGADSYQKCIDKCQLLLRYYPKSKYVDDALYLIGMSRFYRNEHVQSRAAFEELEMRFPKSEYIERSYYYSGLAALRQGDEVAAAESFGKLLVAYPDSKLNVEAVFRGAEARLDARDFEAARAALRAFMQDHAKSPLVTDAQMRLARTYYEEGRYAEARAEYERVLGMDATAEARFEAQLRSALAQRYEAEAVLANPTLQRQSRMRRGAARLEPENAPPAAADGKAGPGAPGSPEGRRPPDEMPAGGRHPGETPPAETPPPFPGEEGPGPGSPLGEEEEEGLAVPPEGALDDSLDALFLGEEAPAMVRSGAPVPPAGGADSTLAAVADSTLAAADTAAAVPLSEAEEAQLQNAEAQLEEVSARLAALRKPANKLGRQVDLEIELAVTRALLGEPREAIASLDQLARTQPRTETSAWARYEIGEINRRLGRFDKAKSEYDESLKEKRISAVSAQAQRKSAAIVARGQAKERLREAPAAIAAWNATREGGTDSLGLRVETEAKYEAMANQQLRMAEIDLFDLGQPLTALEEFQQVLARFPGSLQSARAAFGIAYVYDHELRDRERAHAAYATVAHDYAGTPQAREAQAILDGWAAPGAEGEVNEPSSPP